MQPVNMGKSLWVASPGARYIRSIDPNKVGLGSLNGFSLLRYILGLDTR